MSKPKKPKRERTIKEVVRILNDVRDDVIRIVGVSDPYTDECPLDDLICSLTAIEDEESVEE